MDLEQLALKYSLPKVRKALEAMRITPGQRFFPRPDEVAEEIENQRERTLLPTVSDAAKYSADLERWKREHMEYRKERGW